MEKFAAFLSLLIFVLIFLSICVLKSLLFAGRFQELKLAFSTRSRYTLSRKCHLKKEKVK